MNLFEFNNEIAETLASIMETADEQTGEVDGELLARLEELNVARDEKLENLGLWIKQLNVEAAAIEDEEKKLKARRKVKENMVDRLKNYISNAMLAAGEKKFERPRIVFSFLKSEAVEITGELPKKYLVKTVTEKPDKKAIKEALKAGQKVRGAELVEKQNLQIK